MLPVVNLHPEPSAMDMICQFNKLKPPKFEGGADPLSYEEWMRKLENLFEIMDCPARFNVALATYQFEKVVEFWWGIVKPRGDEPPPTWERLKELMDAKYYPKDAKRAKEQEFLSLRQGNISVMEYATKFNELSRFSLNEVATQEMRIGSFQKRDEGKH